MRMTRTARRIFSKPSLLKHRVMGSVIEPLERRAMFSATLMYWDPTGASPASGGSGTWDTSTSEWRSGSTTGTLMAWSNTGDVNGPFQAVFSTGSGTVAMGAAITASGLTFTSSDYTVTGGSGSYAMALSGFATPQISVSTGTVTISALLSGSQGLTKTGAGTLDLATSNTYGGGTTLSAGILNISSDSALGAVPSSTATNITFSGSATLQAGAASISLAATRGIAIGSSLTATIDTQSYTLTVNGPVSNTASNGILSKAGTTGTLVLAGSDSFAASSTIKFAGNNNVSAGTLLLTNSGALGSNAITVDAQLTSYSANSILALSGGITIGSNVNYLVSGHQPGYEIELDSQSGNNTFNGTFTIESNGGGYAISSSNSAGTLTLGGSITEAGTSTARKVVFQGAGNGIISGAISDGNGSISPIFAGNAGTTWILTGTSNYTGVTNISSGTVIVDGAITRSNGITVQSGATLGGSGDIYSAVTVNSGATLAPGDVASTGILTTGSVTLASGSTLALVLNGSTPGTDYDQLSVNGLVSVGGATLSLTGTRTSSDPTALTLINNGEYLPISGTFSGHAEGSAITGGSVTYYISYTGGVGFDGGTNDGLSCVIYDSSTPVVSVANIDNTSAIMHWTDNWIGSSYPTAIYVAENDGQYDEVGEVAAGVTTFTLTYLDTDSDFTVGVAPAPGGSGPGAPTTDPVALSTSVYQYTVSVPSSLSEGIAANSNSGNVTIANSSVWASSAVEAAEQAGISVSDFVSVPPSGPSTTNFSYLIETADATGNTAPAYEESLSEALGLSPDQIVVAVEDGTDADYNDAFAEITVTAV